MNLLCQLFARPAIARDWGAGQWNTFLPLARSARLLGRSLYLFEHNDLIDVVPGRLLDQLRGAVAQTRYVQGQALRELRHVARALGGAGIPLIALKGGAYLVAGLPSAQWRNLSDIDVLVPAKDIDAAERVLKQAHWVPSGDFDEYDRHYYRDWMHEVPPLKYPGREMEVDIHHNLSPPVSRIRIDAERLWADASMIEGPGGTHIGVLAPVDLLLHNAVHLFMNDELRGGLRDVVDFRDLYGHFFAADPAFGRLLCARARALGCGRPLYYALTTAQRLLALQVSPEVIADVEKHAPAAPVARLMHRLIAEVLAPRQPAKDNWIAGQLLYIRSHWVRMPAGMLFRHLTHKYFKQKRTDEVSAQDLPG